MSVEYCGGVTIGAVIPGATAALALALPQLQNQVDALAAFTPPSLSWAAMLNLAGQIVADIEAAMAAGIEPPSIAIQVEIVANLLAALRLDLQAILDFKGLLTAAGVHLYAYQGRVDHFGSEFSSQFAGGLPGGNPADDSRALVLITEIPQTWSNISLVFKVSP